MHTIKIIVQISVVAAGLISAYFWWRSGAVKFAASEKRVSIGGQQAVGEDDVKGYVGEVAGFSKKAASLSALTMALTALQSFLQSLG